MQISSFDLSQSQKSNGLFCASRRLAITPLHNTNEGVKVIIDILQRESICQHDIEDINKVYEEMRKLKDYNQETVLKRLTPKIQRISRSTSIKCQIAFYYIQKFAHQDLRIVKHYNHVVNTMETTLEKTEEMATYLPCCSTEEDFERDVSALLGPHRSVRVIEILSEKKSKLQRQIQIRFQITIKKLELEKLRRDSTRNLPTYLDDLLEKGYIHLFDHLVKMKSLSDRNARKAAVEEMQFSEISHVILEMRDAICRQVESSILTHNRTVLFLLGRSGSGKSTTLCSLRGDEMVYQQGRYVSRASAKTLIGDELATSCTFLPTVENVKGWVIVDFPGFDDSHGPLISLGMECALKALVEKYTPFVLVLEPITNTEGKFVNAANLGQKLKRLFDNKNKCILGITKYSEESNFIHINTLKDKEREKQKADIESLTIEINVLKKYNIKGSDLEEKEQQLALLKRQQEMKVLLPPPDTPEIRERVELLTKKERELSKQIGLKKVIKLFNLEDPHQLSNIFDQLTRCGEVVHVSKTQKLDADDRELLDRRFLNNLFDEIENRQDYSIENKKFDAFEQSVLESSLIKTLYANSCPEIGRFLHLPELDPKIVRSYDAQIVDRCINKYMNFVISTIQISLIERFLVENAALATPAKIEALKRKITKLQNYVMFYVTGISFADDPVKGEEKWVEIQQKLKRASAEAQIKLPVWANKILEISNHALDGVYNWLNDRFRKQALQEAVDKTIDECCVEVVKMYDALQRLNDIKKMIAKQGDIDNAFQSVHISTESMDTLYNTIQRRISAVAIVYGEKEWNKRVSFLASQFMLKDFDPKIETHISCILAYAYWLIEPDVHPVYQVEIDLGVVRSLNDRVEGMVRELQTLQIKVQELGQTEIHDWNGTRDGIKVVGEILRKIEASALKETERGIEFFTDKEHFHQNEIMRVFAHAVGEAAMYAESLANEIYGGKGDLGQLLKKIEATIPLVRIHAPTKAVVSSWSSWGRARSKAKKVEVVNDTKSKAKKKLTYKLIMLKNMESNEGERRVRHKVTISSAKMMPELNKDIRERHEINRPLIRTLYAAALLKAYEKILKPK